MDKKSGIDSWCALALTCVCNGLFAGMAASPVHPVVWKIVMPLEFCPVT